MPETPATGCTATTQRCDPHPIQGDDRGAGGARLHSIGRPRRAPVGAPEVYTSKEYASEEHREDSEPNACGSPSRVPFAEPRTEPAQGVLGGSQMNVPGFRRGEVPAT